ncbi:hypothetical protein SK128_009384 [Halocaridina rubra]|uniref:Uncharacterized protein n=1 Tax=Halocaridina rubra TaxID=373956 RepID=A0AAN9ABL4_HALRR
MTAENREQLFFVSTTGSLIASRGKRNDPPTADQDKEGGEGEGWNYKVPEKYRKRDLESVDINVTENTASN